MSFFDSGQLGVRNNITGELATTSLASSLTLTQTPTVLLNGDVIFTARDSDSGIENIYRFRRESASVEALTDGADTLNYLRFAVSADGSTLAFTSETAYTDGGTKASADSDGLVRLYTMNLATGIIRRDGGGVLNPLGDLGTLSLSSDGSYVALTGSPVGRIRMARVGEGGFSTTLTTIATGTTLQNIGVTTSGTVYFTANSTIYGSNPGAHRQIFSFDSTTGQIRQLSTFSVTYTLQNIGLAPDGESIFFTSTGNITGENSAAFSQLYRFGVDGSISQVTDARSATSGIFSRDGRRRFGSVNGATQLQITELTAEDARVTLELGEGSLGALSIQFRSFDRTLRGIGAYSFTSQLVAQAALANGLENIQRLAEARGLIGAGLSRLTTAQNVLRAQRDEATTAAARIQDADVASESAQLIRGQILQRVGTALLAQANQAPRLALDLLRQN